MHMKNIHIDFVHICENAFLAQNGALNVIQIFDRISAEQFPATHPRFSIAIGVTAPHGSHEMNLQIVNEQAENEQDQVLVQTNGTIQIDNEGGGHARFFANFINTQFPQPGRYAVYVFVGDETRVQYLTLAEEKAQQ